MEHFRAPAQCLGEAWRANRQDHELLHIDAVVGMRTTVDDIHHRQRQAVLWPAGANRTVQRQAGRSRCRLGAGQRNGQQRVGAKARLLWRSIEADQAGIHLGLVRGVQAVERSRDIDVDVLHRLLHPLAEIASLVAVTQFQRFTRSRGCTGRRGSEALRAIGQHHLGRHRRVAPGIEQLVAADFPDCSHVDPLTGPARCAAGWWCRPR
ncbi:hypothetical protein D9M72_248750 [compost metagenome]